MRALHVVLPALVAASVALLAPAAAGAATPTISISLDSADGQHYGVGKTATATVRYFDASTGAAITGAPLDYSIAGSGGTTTGSTRTDTNGRAQIQFTDTAQATDQLVVWDDSGTPNGAPDSGEPQSSTDATFWYGQVQIVSGPKAGVFSAPLTNGSEFQIQVIGEDGEPVGLGETVNWALSGANDDSGTVQTDDSGDATIDVSAQHAGPTTFTATWDNPDAASADDPNDSRSDFYLTTIQAPSSTAITGVTVAPTLACQVMFAGDTSGEFFSGFPGSCGTYLRFGGQTFGPGSITAVSQTDVSGSGTTTDPFTFTTVAELSRSPSLYRLTAVTSYVADSDTYQTDITVTDLAGTAQTVTLAQYADCFLGNNDHGWGFLDPSSGGVFCTKNQNTDPSGHGRIEGFVPLETGFSELEGGFSEVLTQVDQDDTLPNTCVCNSSQAPSGTGAGGIDNGMALAWQMNVPANGSVTRSFLTAFSPSGTIPAGNGSGSAGGGTPVLPPAPQPQTTTAQSSSPPPLPITPPATPVPPPVAGKTGNATPVSGIILVRLPGSLVYVPIQSVTSLPVGTLIDATRGVVDLTVSDGHGGTQTGEFSLGKFRFSQAPGPGGKLITNIRMAGGKWGVCAAQFRSLRATSWANAARRRVVRYLEAKAHGAFNVVGRNASGVERGTQWETLDTCNSTEVRVQQDAVLVTDLLIHKTFTITAGHSYSARDGERAGRRRRR